MAEYDKELMEKYLSPEEISGLESANWHDRLAGRVACKLALKALEPKIPYSEMAISNDAVGWPYAIGFDNYYYSISHSYGRAVATIATVTVGIDIEKYRAIPLKTIRYIARPSELRDIDESDHIRIWCAKEAVMKATRKGFGLDPKKILVSIIDDRTCGAEILASEYSDNAKWTVQTLTNGGHVIALAYGKKQHPIINWHQPDSLSTTR